MMSYFRLNPECYLVNGKQNSVIYDVFTGNIIALNDTESKKIILAENNEKIVKDDFFTELEKLKVGNFFDNPIYVEKFRNWSSWEDFTLWKNPPNLVIAQIQVTNRCNLDCSFCQSRWCPNCTRLGASGKEMDVAGWKEVIEQLECLDCKQLVITGGEATLYPKLNEIIEHVKKMEVHIVTNGLQVPEYIRDLDVIVNLFPHTIKQPVFKEIRNNILKLRKPYLNAVGLKKGDVDSLSKITAWKGISLAGIDYEPLTKDRLLKTHLNDFYIRKHFDPGLFGRITITSSGDVIPCFMLPTSLGNVRETELNRFIETLIENYWKLNKDQINGCKECEFRYSCTVCLPVIENQKIACTYDGCGKWKT